jgi:hypothetical protein
MAVFLDTAISKRRRDGECCSDLANTFHNILTFTNKSLLLTVIYCSN